MRVYLMSRPSLDYSALETFFLAEGIDSRKGWPAADANDAEALVEASGRLCYMSFGKGRKSTQEHISHLIEVGHFSVLEHANYTLFITGVSRSLTHELIRHRHFSYSQLSQRYVDHSKMKTIMPSEVVQRGLVTEWDSLMLRTQDFYAKLMHHLRPEAEKLSTAETKNIRTIARSVLPNAMETKIAVTGNVRAWREFIKKRNITEADPEIRTLAAEIGRVLTTESPVLFGGM